jgi:hypothetical protein
MAERIVDAAFAGKVITDDHPRTPTTIEERCMVRIDAGVQHRDPDTCAILSG